MKRYFKAYVTSDRVRAIINDRDYTRLNTNPGFNARDYKAVPDAYRRRIPDYIIDYVPLNRFAA